jgi:hypothetical protein
MQNSYMMSRIYLIYLSYCLKVFISLCLVLAQSRSWSVSVNLRAVDAFQSDREESNRSNAFN